MANRSGRALRKNHGASARSTIATTPDPLTELGYRVEVQPNGCWAVDGNLHEYTQFKGHNAHHWVWEAIHGPIANGDHVHHECEHKGCINPAHLRRLTASEHASHHHNLKVA